MQVRRVLLRVANVPWMEDYHGREAGLVGEVVDAVEIVTEEIGSYADVVAYVDDRDGQTTELAEALAHLDATPATRSAESTMRRRVESEFAAHAKRRFLHGEVTGARA